MAATPRLIVYHTSWACYGRAFQVKDIAIDAISDINYAFWDLREGPGGFYVPASPDAWADTDKRYLAGEGVEPPDSWSDSNPYHGNFGQFMKLKSIGGWTMSKHFSSAVLTPNARHAFIQEILAILMKYDGLFDRIDLDWEYISPPGKNYGDGGNESRPEDASNFAIFLQNLRDALDNNGKRNIEISACIAGDPKKMEVLPLAAFSKFLTTLNVMTYDFASSSFGPCVAGHQTNLKATTYAPLSIELAVDFLLARGVPAPKIVIGAAFYSRAFANTDGLGHPSSGVSPDKSWEAGVVDYKSLPVAGAQEFWDSAAQATYSYDPAKRVLSSYDSVESIRAKCKFVRERGLGGIIVWESSADFPLDHPRSLTAELARGLGTLARGSNEDTSLQAAPWISHQSAANEGHDVYQVPQQLPPGFIAQWSEQYNRHFYVNTATGASQWDIPTNTGPQQPAAGTNKDPQKASWL
ncbi:hypothetical protein HDU83_000610 [Entophlyctis luteolus]|nr:hypothetical protein HDU83_000610 [Entophlyctis luteolus]